MTGKRFKKKEKYNRHSKASMKQENKNLARFEHVNQFFSLFLNLVVF